LNVLYIIVKSLIKFYVILLTFHLREVGRGYFKTQNTQLVTALTTTVQADTCPVRRPNCASPNDLPFRFCFSPNETLPDLLGRSLDPSLSRVISSATARQPLWNINSFTAQWISRRRTEVPAPAPTTGNIIRKYGARYGKYCGGWRPKSRSVNPVCMD